MQRLYLHVLLLRLQVLLFVTDAALITGKQLQLELQNVADNVVGISRMQESYDRLTNTSVKLDGKAIVDEISSSMSSLFGRLQSALTKLKDAVEKNYDRSTTSTSLPECCRINSASYDTRFRSNVNYSHACYTKSSHVDKLSAKYPTSAVEQVMKQNYEDNNNLLWQYFASKTGTYINYPSVKLTDCDYDPRFRPYFVTGVSPKPKDVVITIDTSTSMSQPVVSFKTLMQIAKEAAITVIKTLNPNDRFGVVSFNDKATKAKGSRSQCFTDQLAIVTADNTKDIITYINSLSFNGGTNYENALRASFEYFIKSDVSIQGEERERLMLFLTDGQTVTGANPLQVIREENGFLNNSVTIFTYGLGSLLSDPALQLLRNMSLQTMNDETKGETKSGIFEHIENPANLESTMGSYYNFLSKGSSDAIFTVPYKDRFSDIGLLTSVCLPAFDHATFIGIVCIDIKISDLKFEMSILNDNDEKSYTFLIDGYGRTLIHPLLPLPQNVTDDEILLDISHFETTLKSTSSIEQMKRGQNGEISLKNTRTLPRGKVLEEGITTQAISSNFYWSKVAGTNYTVCVVIGGSGIKHKLGVQIGRVGIFSYHIRRLGSDTSSSCRHFARYATKDGSLVMLTPSAFKEPNKYLYKLETDVTVTKYENYFSGKTTNADTFKDTVLNSMVVTHDVESLWKNSQKEASYVIWRYIVTVDGIVRMYPGVEIKKDYEPKLRPWYWRSIAQKGKLVISPPYQDAWGSGYLITLSKTIFQGRYDKTVAAVMGTDFPIYFFYYLLLEQYPICDKADYSCFVIDTSGFVVIHKDFVTSYTDPKLQNLYHITNKEGKIARDLMSKGILEKSACTDYKSVQRQYTYRVTLTTHFKDGVEDPEYEMRPVENTNIFLIIKKTISDKSPCCQTQISPELFKCSLDPGECECLCFRNIDFDFCRNEYASSDASPPCSAPAPKYDSVYKEEEIKIKDLPTCFETNCSMRNNVKPCYNVAGCSWCVETASGNKTKSPFCHLKEVCPFGKCVNDQNCKPEKHPTPDPTMKKNSMAAILGISIGCGVGLVLIVLIVVIIVKRRKAGGSQPDYLTPVDVNYTIGGNVKGGPYGFPAQERNVYKQTNSQNSSTESEMGYQNIANAMAESVPT